ncbi:MAG: hypothetical protein H6711_10785 [Myxococcales bacterium]|nr:hypothetical protein [Myxococcales bacterium]
MSERWRLIAGWTPEPWLALLLALAALIALIDAWQGLRRPALPLARGQRLALFGLRLLGIAALAVVVGEATIAIETVAPTGPRVVVLVDRSASMALADGDTLDGGLTPRIERIRALWAASADARTRWQADGLALEVRSFARRSEALASAAVDALAVEADGGASDLTRALVELARTRDAGEGRPLAGLVVLSDGLVAADAAAEAPLRSAAAELAVPITTVAAGAPAIRDLGLRRILAGEFAFVENVTELGAEVVAHGYEGQAIAVDLERDGEVIATVEASAPADGEALPIRFEVAPDRIGHFVYAIAIRPLADEATLVNNRWSFVVKVLRDKVRVLHVAGRPDWDVRALRTLLGRDPNVELLSYYILRGLDDSDREDPTAPLSLIAFPTDQLFSEELGSFDLVILHNFDARSHQVGRYLGDMADYVSEGGALVMIGGDLGLATGDYSGSLGRVLPVMVDRPSGLDTAPFRPVVAEPGRRHPITAWLTDPRLGGWEGLPALDSFNRLRPSGDAGLQPTVLLRHPDGPPLLTVAEPGKGRSVVLATGASWRLGFAADLPLIDGARPYDLLWLGIIRWLLRDAAAERLSLEVAEPTLAPGEAIDLRAAALSTSYAPEPGVDIEWALRPLGPPPAEGEPETPAIARGTWTTDALGRASERVPPPPPGAYEVVASRRRPAGEPADAPIASARRVVLVEAEHRELAEVDADPGTRRLAELAARSGGRALEARSGDRLPALLPLAEGDTPGSARGALRVESRREIPLWDGFGALVLLTLALGSEWILRRRWGLA